MISSNTPIEQLWYTWSDMGIDTIRAGYRIRAASPGLSDPNSAQIQHLNRYQRYLLPRGADVTIPPSIAPISLALIDTGQERILVHKVYTGRDGVGRYGTFFVHLLAKLPAAFSPLDAISLWRSPFWQTSDDMGQPSRRSTSLEATSLEALRRVQRDGRLADAQLDAKLKKFFPYVVEAYLTKNLLFEKESEAGTKGPLERRRLYIAGSDDLLAGMISGLVHILPPQLVQELTFSTYESDVNEAKTEIVGTCWLSEAEPIRNPAVEQLLPAQYYTERLALNCYTGASTTLKGHPEVISHPLAARFAQDATSYLLANAPARSKFTKLLTIAKKYPRLTIGEFLERYSSIVLRTHKPTQADVEPALSPRYPVDYELAAENLSDPDYQEKLIDLILTVPNWWTKYRANVTNLYNHGTEIPLLGEALHTISMTQAYPSVLNITQNEVTRLVSRTRPERDALDAGAAFRMLVDLMTCTTPPATNPELWLKLLQDLCSIKNFLLFFHLHWNAYTYVMKIWTGLLASSPDGTNLISPFLVIPWERFGDFLALGLPLEWTALATEHLAYGSDAQPALPAVIEKLERRPTHAHIQNLLKQLAAEPRYWKAATGLFNMLVQGNYREKMALFYLLLNSSMGEDEKTVQGLLAYAQLTLSEQAVFLKHYGPRYLLNKKLATTIMNMFEDVANSDLQQDKMSVLSVWLAAPDLSSWFRSTSMLGSTNLSKVLKSAHLDSQQCGELLLQSGPHYIPLDPESQELLSLFKNYAKERTPQRMDILWIWLNCNLSSKYLEQVLNAASLTYEERRRVLLNYGERYLRLYPQLTVFTPYIRELLNDLQIADLALFKNNSTTRGPSAEERLLQFLSKHPQSSPWSDLIYSWSIVGQFVNNPSMLSNDWKRITAAIDWLITSNVVQKPNSTNLIKELAFACLPDEHNTIHAQNLANNIIDVSSALSSGPLREQLLLDIAVEAGERIRRKRYEKTLFEPCVLVAFRSRTMFETEAEREEWVKVFLDSLFLYDDQRTFKDLSKRAKHWSTDAQATWQRYLAQRQHATPPSRLAQAQQFLARKVTAVIPGKRGAQAAGTPAGGQSPQTMLQPATGQAGPGVRVALLAEYTKHKMTFLATAITLLLVIVLMIYGWLAAASVTLTVTAQNYYHSIALTAHTGNQAGAVPAQLISPSTPFHKKGTGHATGTGRVGITSSQTSVCFGNAGKASVAIPTGSIVATIHGIQFQTTTAETYLAHTDCTNNPVLVPVKAVEPGENGNVAANSITVIPADTLAAIASNNGVATNSLQLTVTNFVAATGGTAKTAPAITQQDLDKVKSALSDQLRGEITAWANSLAKDGAVGQPIMNATLVNTPAKDTTIDTGGTFNAEVEVQAKVLLVREADLQAATLSQLKSALKNDKDFSSYTIAENARPPLAITDLQTKNSDDQSMKLTFAATTVIMAPISKKGVQNMVIGRLPADAKKAVQAALPAVQKIDIQVRPFFFPWLIPLWPDRVDVTILPNITVNDLQTTRHS